MGASESSEPSLKCPPVPPAAAVGVTASRPVALSETKVPHAQATIVPAHCGATCVVSACGDSSLLNRDGKLGTTSSLVAVLQAEAGLPPEVCKLVAALAAAAPPIRIPALWLSVPSDDSPSFQRETKGATDTDHDEHMRDLSRMLALPDRSLIQTPMGYPLPAQPLTRDTLVIALADVLEEVFCKKPFELAVADGKTHNSTFMFQSETFPKMNLKQYLHRILKYTGISGEAMILSIVHIARIVATLPNFPVNILTIHRLLLTSMLISAKYFDDSFLNNKRYAQVGCVAVKELNTLEVEFLFLIDFDLYVPLSEYARIFHALLQGLDQASQLSTHVREGPALSAATADGNGTGPLSAMGTCPDATRAICERIFTAFIAAIPLSPVPPLLPSPGAMHQSHVHAVPRGHAVLPTSNPTMATYPVDDNWRCTICMTHEMNVFFKPCNHLTACSQCANRCSRCPICRQPVTDVQRLYRQRLYRSPVRSDSAAASEGLAVLDVDSPPFVPRARSKPIGELSPTALVAVPPAALPALFSQNAADDIKDQVNSAALTSTGSSGPVSMLVVDDDNKNATANTAIVNDHLRHGPPAASCTAAMTTSEARRSVEPVAGAAAAASHSDGGAA